MQVNRRTITNQADWLDWRKQNINGSEIGALFGCSPYMTPYALYAAKADLAELAAPDDDVLQRGRIMEPSVAQAVREEHPEWKVEKSIEYVWTPDHRLGCTPDFDVWCPERGLGVLQAKTVAKQVFDRDWQDGPPFWIVLQTLQEMMLANVQWGAIAVLICEFPFKLSWRIYPFTRHEATEAKIKAKAAQFWADIRDARPPKPDYALDGEFIRQVYAQDDGRTIDLTGDNRMAHLLERYEALTAVGKSAEDELKTVKAEIADKLGDASYAIVPGWETVSFKSQTRKAHTVKEATFRVLRVKRGEARRAAA